MEVFTTAVSIAAMRCRPVNFRGARGQQNGMAMIDDDTVYGWCYDYWFLDDKQDTRSSNYLEDAATEIQVQGLELDYTCILWDADLRFEEGEWHYYRFNTRTCKEWRELKNDTESKRERMQYMLNAYRVLLTRARAGMVICVPAGNGNINASGFPEDSTRLPEY